VCALHLLISKVARSLPRRFVLHLLAYLVPTLVLGCLWHLVLFAGTYHAPTGAWRIVW
jgi:hypothetical protein